MAKAKTKTETTIPTPDYEVAISKNGVTVQAHTIGEKVTLIVTGTERITTIDELNTFNSLVNDVVEAITIETITTQTQGCDECNGCDCCMGCDG